MLPGNLQYWQSCKFRINEPIHFGGPSPGDQSAITQEEKKEEAETSKQEKHPVTNQDDPLSPAQQLPTKEITTSVQKVNKEKIKKPEPSQIVEYTEGATMSIPSIDAQPGVNQQPIETAQQTADPN